MRPTTQLVVLTFLGATLVRLTLSEAYLNYVNAWMRWPVALSGVAIILVAVVVGLRGRDRGHDAEADERVPAASWLLLLPVAVVFLISPPALGAWFAERGANQAVTPPAGEDKELALPSLPTDFTSSLTVNEFVVRAEFDPETLVDRPVALTGFVSVDDAGNWFVTRNAVNCCAADAAAFRARVLAEGPTPPRDRWVRVIGEYAAPDGDSVAATPDLVAEAVERIKKPRNPYE